MRRIRTSLSLGVTVALAVVALPAGAQETPDAAGSPGDETITLPLNDSAAGGTYDQDFERAYAGETAEGTPVYVYVPAGALDDEGTAAGVPSLDPAFDHDPTDDFVPCPEHDPADYRLTQAEVDALGDRLADQIVEVNEAHFGPIGLADPDDPDSDALVTVVYNVQDDMYYDCGVTSYTAGYFAPDFIDSAGMNIIVIDAYDWANRVGDQDDNPDGRSFLYEGVIAHELEHLLMNYSDPGELSWIDEGLADFAAFLNGFGADAGHVMYHQVFHRETSLTKWGGGLEDYGASYSFIQYLWEQAGGNGDGSYDADLTYDGVAGDLLIKTIFEEQADGMEGVQNAIDTFNAATDGDLRDADELFRDWVVAVYLDDEDSSRWDLKALDLGPETGGWSVDIANEAFWDDRGRYQGAMPEQKWQRKPNVPGQTALPFGTSYETFRNPGGGFSVDFVGEDETGIAPYEGDTHWYAGYASQAEHVLEVTDEIAGGQTLTFASWYFIEEGWDYGFVEARVDGAWRTLPVVDSDSGETITTDDDPHGNNAEGNGITGTSGGTYFVDEPTYVELEAVVPEDADALRFRYSTDAAYLDTGWFVDAVQLDGEDAAVASDEGEWIETTGQQDNHWTVQVIATCDLTPEGETTGELVDDAGNHVYRFAANEVHTARFDPKCYRGSKGGPTVAISNMPTGDLTVLDADYEFRVTTGGRTEGR